MIFFRKEHPFLFFGSAAFLPQLPRLSSFGSSCLFFQVTSLSLVFSSLSGFAAAFGSKTGCKADKLRTDTTSLLLIALFFSGIFIIRSVKLFPTRRGAFNQSRGCGDASFNCTLLFFFPALFTGHFPGKMMEEDFTGSKMQEDLRDYFSLQPQSLPEFRI